MPITKSNTTITIDDYAAGSPCTLQAIYDADVAGGWGLVTKIGANIFYLAGSLTIGLGTNNTYLKSTDQHFVVTLNFVLANNGYAQFGDINGNGDTYNGCYLEVLGTGDTTSFGNYDRAGPCNFKLYNSKLSVPNCRIVFGQGATSNFEAIDSLIETLGWALYGAGTVLKNTIITSMGNASNYALGPRNTFTEDISNVTIQKSYYGIMFWSTFSSTLKNCSFKNIATKDFVINSTVNHYVIDVNSNWNIYYAGTGAGRIYRQYTFNLNITDEADAPMPNASVVIKDKDGTVVVNTTTDANGDIAEQTVTYGYYTYASGETPILSSPHTLIITKAGYETYQYTWSFTEKADWKIKIKPARGYASVG